MRTEEIAYRCGDKQMTGYLAVDETRRGPRPGVLVCHQGGGISEHTRERARMVAQLGYAAFALDMYGEVPVGGEAMMKLVASLMQDQDELRRRALAGLDMLKAQDGVDPARLGAIGFCFGGAVVLELARASEDIKAVVAFHPGMVTPVPLVESDARPVHARVMVCAGADDPFIPAASREKFIALMEQGGADWQLLVYGGAVHSFTDRAVDAMNLQGFKFDAATDRRSWAAMRDLFAETFGEVQR